ncbi:MauE/DoxX family redox-associated membrane protein [Rathayibacter tritici]|uniref:Methylamine utilisation protein MauE domain-containing protein n=1 Tax=Rathayibacter tritici TaxID=33888 RepID=A0A160KQP0_9MICO|nr:MauE/DoxX family redox-associated membrane protein [Rathayibacter tritici]AND15519.1 hypothetical protein A6122_0359 [Rathayibacter tritici]PPI45930.1 hypothetical protein C5D18_05475 [Rathayibacter tritici]
MLDVILAVAGWCAGAVLVISGALKLGRTAEFRASLAALGVPLVLRRRRWFATAFPVVEIVLGAAVVLSPAPLHRAALVPVVLLDIVFLVVAVRAVRAREDVDCECFGGLGSARMTGRTVARNAVLLVLALAGVLGGLAPSALLAGGGGVAAVAASGLAAALAAVSLVLVRDRRAGSSVAHATSAAQATSAAPSPFASPADPNLALVTAAGERLTLEELSRPATHLVFFSPSCTSCHHLVERFRWWPNGLREGEELLPVFLGNRDEFAAYEVYAPLVDHALYDPVGQVAAVLGRSATPGHVLITPERPLGDGWTSGGLAIEARVLRPDFIADVEAGVLIPASRIG